MLQAYSSTAAFGIIKQFPVVMRAAPTCSTSGTYTPFGSDGSTSGHTAFTSTTINKPTKYEMVTNAWGGGSGISAGNAVVVEAAESTAYMEASAEL